VEDLEKIRPYEPILVKAAWNVFGKSYEYRKKYDEYKKKRMIEEKSRPLEGQLRTCIHNRGMSAGRGILPPIEANFFGGLTPGEKI